LPAEAFSICNYSYISIASKPKIDTSSKLWRKNNSTLFLRWQHMLKLL
jgi:hypothetical protein